jgi:hypothetical protein
LLQVVAYNQELRTLVARFPCAQLVDFYGACARYLREQEAATGEGLAWIAAAKWWGSSRAPAAASRRLAARPRTRSAGRVAGTLPLPERLPACLPACLPAPSLSMPGS